MLPEFPPEILHKILLYLEPFPDYLSLRLVNHTFKKITEDTFLTQWRYIRTRVEDGRINFAPLRDSTMNFVAPRN